MEMVSSGEVDHIHISFMIAGHTKFAPDRLFSTIGNAYKTTDIFTIEDLKGICDQSAVTRIVKGDKILTWRDSLGEKYSDLPGVRKHHDFLVVKAHDGKVVMKVRELCFAGQWKDSPLRIVHSAIPGRPQNTYRGKHHSISTEKMANMVTMYDRYITPERRPEYLPPIHHQINNPPASSSTTTTNTSHLVTSTTASTKKKRQSGKK